jgi:hypothetical protein
MVSSIRRRVIVLSRTEKLKANKFPHLAIRQPLSRDCRSKIESQNGNEDARADSLSNIAAAMERRLTAVFG